MDRDPSEQEEQQQIEWAVERQPEALVMPAPSDEIVQDSKIEGGADWIRERMRGISDAAVSEALRQDAEQTRAADAAMTPEALAEVGKRLRAKVGDVLRAGPVPGNVLDVRDRQDDMWYRTGTGWHCAESREIAEDTERHDRRCGASDLFGTWAEDYAPFTVTAVSESPSTATTTPAVEAPRPERGVPEWDASAAPRAPEGGHRIEIGPISPGGTGPLLLDGTDVSAQVRGATVDIMAGEPTRVMLDLLPRALGVLADGARTEVSGRTAALLRSLGWTRAEEARTPAEVRTDADHRAEVLARAVEAHEQNRHVEESEDLWESVRSALASWQAVAGRPSGPEPHPRSEPAAELGFTRIPRLWEHSECGTLTIGAERPGPHGCAMCDHAPGGSWRKVYVQTTAADVAERLKAEHETRDMTRRLGELEAVAEAAAGMMHVAIDDPSNDAEGLRSINALAEALVTVGMLQPGEAERVAEISADMVNLEKSYSPVTSLEQPGERQDGAGAKVGDPAEHIPTPEHDWYLTEGGHDGDEATR